MSSPAELQTYLAKARAYLTAYDTSRSNKALLLSNRSKIDHPDPDAAIEFALLAITSILQQAVLEERMPQHLDEELVRLFFRYLGLET